MALPTKKALQLIVVPVAHLKGCAGPRGEDAHLKVVNKFLRVVAGLAKEDDAPAALHQQQLIEGLGHVAVG